MSSDEVKLFDLRFISFSATSENNFISRLIGIVPYSRQFLTKYRKTFCQNSTTIFQAPGIIYQNDKYISSSQYFAP
ncbi:hypothetical protein FGO68_gene2434 [Halteria grandinella]|uniref:Uncharacterized protein n=1 Tax=Halteria grandinella TaxID=5974 RepID=A0A8J8NEG1_HALGN|nr:hypothetical protein FGO68_gene2434 [Halteria grandinella]